MQTHNVPEWVEEVQCRKFRWAGRVARCVDQRWTRSVLLLSMEGHRSQGRPLTRWVDCLNKFFQGDAKNVVWTTLAQDEQFWLQMENDYVDFILG